MYIFILWACLLTSPQCPMWHSVHQLVMIFPAKDRGDCEAKWQASKEEPDADGTVSRHKCEPVSEDL